MLRRDAAAVLRQAGRVLPLLLCLALLAVQLAFDPAPWFVALFVLAALLVIQAATIGRVTIAVILVNVAAAILGLAGFESYLAYNQSVGDGTRMEGTVEDGTTRDDLLGYAPLKNTRLVARKLYGNQLIYDVVYTIDADGLRIAPPSIKAPGGCAVFFGDSVSFGEGLQDDQAFPYQFGVKTGGSFAVYNFAYSGYGPHQMLANLRSGRVKNIVHCEVTHYFYLALLEHIARVAGLASWDRHGPRFSLRDGVLSQDGHFDDPPQSAIVPAQVRVSLAKFLAWQRLFGRARDVNAEDLQLFLAVIREAASLAKRQSPHGEFHVILWDGRDDPRLEIIERNLSEAGIVVHRLTTIVPEFAANWQHFVLSEHDLHPNALLDGKLAEYLASRLKPRPAP